MSRPRPTGRLTDATSRARRIENRGPGEIPDGYALCDCGKIGKVRKSGRIGAHKSPKGYECSGMVGYQEVVLDEVPEVVIRNYKKPKQASLSSDRRAAHYEAVQGVCRECGKKLYGNRTLCGACGVRLGR